MKLSINANYIPEEQTSLSPNTCYYLYMTDGTQKELKEMQPRHEYLIDKRKNDFSSFLKVILLNTYLYVTNTEVELISDIAKTLEKEYYKDLDKDFIEKIVKSGKEQDFIKEIIRTRLLKTTALSEDSDDAKNKLKKVQFRLAQDDDLLRYIFAGSVCMSISEYLTSLLNYFMSASYSTQKTILTYQNTLMLKRCIADHRCIFINNRKCLPLKTAKIGRTMTRDIFVYIDMTQKRIRFRHFSERDKYEESNEYFQLNSDEQKLLDAVCDYLDNQKWVTFSFDVINTGELPEILKIIAKEYINEDGTITKRVTYTAMYLSDFNYTYEQLIKINGVNIKNLEYSEIIDELFKLLKETKYSF